MGRLLDEDDVMDAINKRISVLQKHPEFRRKHTDIDLYGIKLMIADLPSAQSENDWIPCTKKAHPDTPFRVQVQLDNGWIITAYYQDGEWLSVPDCGEPLLDKWIEAWRELPESYQESEQDG